MFSPVRSSHSHSLQSSTDPKIPIADKSEPVSASQSAINQSLASSPKHTRFSRAAPSEPGPEPDPFRSVWTSVNPLQYLHEHAARMQKRNQEQGDDLPCVYARSNNTGIGKHAGRYVCECVEWRWRCKCPLSASASSHLTLHVTRCEPARLGPMRTRVVPVSPEKVTARLNGADLAPCCCIILHARAVQGWRCRAE